MKDSVVPSTNYYSEFGEYLKKQFASPIRHPTFLLYLLIAVIGAGGLGIWVSMYRQDMGNFIVSLFTYFPAIAMASGFELILKEDQRKFVKSGAFAMASILILIAILVASLPVGIASLIIGVIGYVLSLAFWWVANAENTILHDTSPPAKVTIGGDVNQETNGDIGDLKS